MPDDETRIFAVMDGAFFDDLGAACQNLGPSCQPLYRHVEDQAVIRGGPWLINLYRDGFGPASTPDWAADLESGTIAAEDLAERMRAALEAGHPSGGGMLPVDDTTDRRAVIARLSRPRQRRSAADARDHPCHRTAPAGRVAPQGRDLSARG
ncbi:DUF4123 domain-containing protein [Paracoccus sp. M683]|uniref:DUF4123 domain-containing protein n=1 Tax=Paracoccus sp. M683 TaxID=2594268 RepID=UPI00117BF4EB|nr:DUF4123 domain-containing protein [Paracoccus sp. M683]TRW98189.1 DUF4123 domain-containing protein [Paracoccus sp. M683]